MANEVVTWTHPNGTITLQGTSDISILQGRRGLDAPPFILTRERTPGGHGSRLTNVYVGERLITIPILVRGDTVSEILATRRNLNSVFNPLDGNGYLTWTALDGTTRILYAYYMSGLEGDDSVADPLWSNHELQLVCVDPFWYSASESSGQLGGSAGANFFTVPFLPLNIGETSISDSLVLNNQGDIEAWPTITIEGPCSAVSVDNDTTGKTIDLTAGSGMTLTAGQIATIETKPGTRSIYRDDATNLFQYLTADSTFFSLQPGNNTLSITASGTTTATKLTVTYRNTYTIK